MSARELTLKFIDEFLQRWPDQLLEQICERLVAGILVVRYGRFPVNFDSHDPRLEFSSDSLDWNMQFEPQTNSCQLWLHSFEAVKTLAQGYNKWGRAHYLRLADEIATSWLRYARDDATSRFTWYDHSASDRAIHMIYLHATLSRAGCNEALVKDLELSLVEHARFLSNPENYPGHQNHGTMMNRALYLVANYIEHRDSNDWRSLALKRLRQNFMHSYSPRMVNLENSSSYHLFNFDLFVTIEKRLLNRFGDTLHLRFDERASMALDFLVELARPDGTFPVIGDGAAKVRLTNIARMSSYEYVKDHRGLQHLLTRGREGGHPDARLASYPDEGYAMLRSSWDYAKHSDELAHVVFTAGYMIDNHRHADDLSFTFYSQGRDVVVDPGTFTYQPGEARNYFKSALAHNTVIVDGEPYRRLGKSGGVGITAAGSGRNFSFVVGKNTRYRDVTIRRTVVLLDSGDLVLVDDIVGESMHNYSHLIHMAHDLSKVASSDATRERRFKDADGFVGVVAHGADEIHEHRGRIERPGPGLVSEKFGSAHTTTTLECLRRGYAANFITMIATARQELQLPTLQVGPNAIVVQGGGQGWEIPKRLIAHPSG